MTNDRLALVFRDSLALPEGSDHGELGFLEQWGYAGPPQDARWRQSAILFLEFYRKLCEDAVFTLADNRFFRCCGGDDLYALADHRHLYGKAGVLRLHPQTGVEELIPGREPTVSWLGEWYRLHRASFLLPGQTFEQLNIRFYPMNTLIAACQGFTDYLLQGDESRSVQMLVTVSGELPENRVLADGFIQMIVRFYGNAAGEISGLLPVTVNGRLVCSLLGYAEQAQDGGGSTVGLPDAACKEFLGWLGVAGAEEGESAK